MELKAFCKIFANSFAIRIIKASMERINLPVLCTHPPTSTKASGDPQILVCAQAPARMDILPYV